VKPFVRRSSWYSLQGGPSSSCWRPSGRRTWPFRSASLPVVSSLRRVAGHVADWLRHVDRTTRGVLRSPTAGAHRRSRIQRSVVGSQRLVTSGAARTSPGVANLLWSAGIELPQQPDDPATARVVRTVYLPALVTGGGAICLSVTVGLRDGRFICAQRLVRRRASPGCSPGVVVLTRGAFSAARETATGFRFGA
jgi:hypothetical protein